MSGNIINGPVSPQFHDYEMLKAAEKTNVFREREADSQEEVRRRKKEWTIALILIAIVGTIIFIIVRAGGARAFTFSAGDVQRFALRGTQFGATVEQNETILDARLVAVRPDTYVVYDGGAPRVYTYGSFGAYLFLTFQDEGLQTVQLEFGEGKDARNPKIDYGAFRNRPVEIEAALVKDLIPVLGEPEEAYRWTEGGREIKIVTHPDGGLALEFQQN